ncbi:hypothetical protein SLE2022_352980 [Rubroshorea leprosula]
MSVKKTESSSGWRPNSPPSTPPQNTIAVPEIPIEIVSEEEMAFIDAALAATRSSFSSSSIPSICSSSRSSFPSSSQFQSNVRSIHSITLLSKRGVSGCSEPDIEDSGNLSGAQKRNRLQESFLSRFRSKSGLMVTDFTATDWCEKQVEFKLRFGRGEVNRAMKAGLARHAELEQEVVRKFGVHTESAEDRWATKMINFITGVNQLLFEGLTRELPLIGFVEGVWIVGSIDEIRMPKTETDGKPIIVDIKTCFRDRLPAEPQKRNGRLQLMCYKYLWDTLVVDGFFAEQFFNFFSLNQYNLLSKEIREETAKSGFPAKTLEDMVRQYRTACSMLPLAQDQLLLRYESQKDQSVLAEYQFAYDSDWLKKQLQSSLEFWTGKREANYTPEEERWKCQHCQFESVCPGNPKPNTSQGSPRPDRTPGSPRPDRMPGSPPRSTPVRLSKFFE